MLTRTVRIILCVASIVLAGSVAYAHGLMPPAAYRWSLTPPYDIGSGSPEPMSLRRSFDAAALRRGVTVATGDKQTLLTLPAGSLPPDIDGTIRVVIDAISASPSELGTFPPGYAFDSNAYLLLVESGSGRPIKLLKPATLVMRYAIDGEVIMQLSEGDWNALRSGRSDLSFELFANIRRSGTYVVGSEALLRKRVPPTPLSHYTLAGGMLTLGGLGALFAGRRRRLTRPPSTGS